MNMLACSDGKQRNLKSWKSLLNAQEALKQIAELFYGRPIDYKKMADDMLVTPTFMEEILEAHAEKGQSSRKASVQQRPNQGKHMCSLKLLP